STEAWFCEPRVYAYNLGLGFEAVAERRAEHAAIWLGPRKAVTYAELNRAANGIARQLLSLHVNGGDLVCLTGEKSLATFASMIACLKLGAAYCIVDPDGPAERLRKILSICKPALFLAPTDFLERFGEVIAALGVRAMPHLPSASGVDEANLDETRDVTGSSPAYVMFTSGSTGFPKGAVMTHANVLNLVDWSQATFGIQESERLTNVNPLFFDNSVFDFY